VLLKQPAKELRRATAAVEEETHDVRRARRAAKVCAEEDGAAAAARLCNIEARDGYSSGSTHCLDDV
jgi:outer membrane protein TolC